MGFKSSILSDTGTLLFVSSGYKGWESFRAHTSGEGADTSHWFPTDSILWKALQDPSSSGDSLTDLLQSPRVKSDAFASFKKALIRFLNKYYKDGVDYSPKLRILPLLDGQHISQYHESIAERFVSAMDLSGFVPAATKYTGSENPSFYFMGFYDSDPTGHTNFLSRVSNHVRPKHNQAKGEIDFYLGAFYDFDLDPKMNSAKPSALTIDLDAFDTFLSVKAASYRKRNFGDDISPRTRISFERAYHKEVIRLKAEVQSLISVYRAALNALAIGLTYITRYTVPSLEVPPASMDPDFSRCHVLRYPLLKGSKTGEEGRFEFLSLISQEDPPSTQPANKDRQDELFDTPPATSSASVPDPAGLLRSVLSSFTNVQGRLAFSEDVLAAHRDYLSGLLSQLEGFVDDKASLMNSTLSAIEALSGIIPDTLTVFDRLMGLLFVMRGDLELLRDPANKNKVRSAGYPAWESWWDSKVVDTKHKGVSLLQSPSLIEDYFKDF
jgi:hypothetical protein